MTDKLDIQNEAELQKIGWMSGDVYITTDNQVYNIYTLNRMSERLVNSSYGYTVDGKFRTKKWIREHCHCIKGMVSL